MYRKIFNSTFLLAKLRNRWRSPFFDSQRHDLLLLTFAVAIGLLAAMGALIFRSLIEWFQFFMWPQGASLAEQIRTAPWWQVILIPSLAGLVIGPIISFWAPEARGPGVPEVILSVTSRQSTIRHRVTFLKGLITSLLLAAGASVGREGPIIQIGSSVGSSLAQFFDLRPDMRRLCLACGAAAGISATFNAPIAGSLFALEIILMNIEVSYISHIVIAAITGSVLSRIFWGDFPAFEIVSFKLGSYFELVFYLGLGLVAGLVSIVFVRLLFGTENLFDRLPLPQWLRPAVGGALLGILGLGLPEVMGVGYETVNAALDNRLLFSTALILLLAKLPATAVCIGSGMSGGIFAPSLFLGAVLGTVVGQISGQFFPELSLYPAFFALTGMGAVVAGTTLAPITAIVTIFELTLHYQIILPLMLACISSTLVVRLLFGVSVYELKLLRKGLNIVRGHDIGILRSICVCEVMRQDVPKLQADTSLAEINLAIAKAAFPHFVVEDEKQTLLGILSLRDLRPVLTSYEEKKDIIKAKDLMSREVITLRANNSLEKAMRLFEKYHYSMFPILDEQKKVLGILTKDDLLEAYDQKVLKDRVLSSSIKP